MLLTLSEYAVASALLSALGATFTGRHPRLVGSLVFPLLMVSGTLAVFSGIGILLSAQTQSAVLPLGLPWLSWHLSLDPLSGLFLAIIGIVVIAVAIYGPSYVREFEHGKDPLPVLGVFTGLFIAGMLMVVLAADAYVFMISWELMSLSSYFLVAFQHENSANRRAAFIYLLMAHIGGLCILLGFAVLAGLGGGFTFEAMRTAELSPLWATVAFLLGFVGFGMKAGIVPLHAWLPEAHPVAPSHISALMSAVMLKVAVYGFLRLVYDLIGIPGLLWYWGVLVLLVGSVTALMGVLYALMQTDIKRVLAYSSVENVGIIFIGLGLSMVFFSTGHPQLGVLGLSAALFHSLNHAVFKGLLFLGAGAVLHSCHERNMEQLGGLLKLMPWTGGFLLIGCMSIASLPPFNGFVSEWLTFQTALNEWAMEVGVLRFVIPTSAAILALTGALALACFVRLYGVSFLGQARSRRARRAREVGKGMRMAQGLLALLCVLLGVLATPVIQVLNHVPVFLSGHGLEGFDTHGWTWLTPVAHGQDDPLYSASYSAPLVLVSLLVVWGLTAWLLRRGKVKTVKRCEPWDCGFAYPNSRMQYTGTAFSQPFRRVFGGLFNVDERVEQEGRQRRYLLQVGDRAWDLFYLPVARLVQLAARQVALLQSGSIRSYLAWSLGTLVLLLWIIS